MQSNETKKSFIDKFPRIFRVALRGYTKRVGRIDWWIWHIIIIVALFSIALFDDFPGLGVSIFIVLFVFKIGATWGRMHDLGHSGWLYVGWLVMASFLGYNLEGDQAKLFSGVGTLIFWAYLGFYPPDCNNKWGENLYYATEESEGTKE